MSVVRWLVVVVCSLTLCAPVCCCLLCVTDRCVLYVDVSWMLMFVAFFWLADVLCCCCCPFMSAVCGCWMLVVVRCLLCDVC